MDGFEKVRVKCPECGLVQWKSEYCHRCQHSFYSAATPSPAPAGQTPFQAPGVPTGWSPGKAMPAPTGQSRPIEPASASQPSMVPGAPQSAPAQATSAPNPASAGFSESPFKDPRSVQQATGRATGTIGVVGSPQVAEPATGTAEIPSAIPPSEPIFIEHKRPPAPQPQTYAEQPLPEGAADIYAPPGADISKSNFPGAAVGRFGTITEDMVHLLERSGSWMKYSSILSYILALTYLVMGIITATVMSETMEETGAPGILVFFIYIVFAVIVFTIAHHLRSASRKAKMIRDSGNPSMDFSEVLQHEHYVWKISGVISLLSLLIMVPALFFIVAGFFQGLVN